MWCTWVFAMLLFGETANEMTMTTYFHNINKRIRWAFFVGSCKYIFLSIHKFRVLRIGRLVDAYWRMCSFKKKIQSLPTNKIFNFSKNQMVNIGFNLCKLGTYLECQFHFKQSPILILIQVFSAMFCRWFSFLRFDGYTIEFMERVEHAFLKQEPKNKKKSWKRDFLLFV